MSEPSTTGYAPVNDVEVYFEEYGSGGTPLIVVHGGFGLISMHRELIGRLAAHRRVVAVELQGHGHTRDVDRDFSYEAFGDDVAGVISHLDLGQADLLGYSLGAGACLRCAIQHPERVRKLAAVSFACRRDGWFPEVRAGFDQLSSARFDQFKQSPMYEAWLQVAPDPDAFPSVMDKIGEMTRRPYDWSDEVQGLTTETLLVFGDADSVPITHAAEFFALLGGGLRDAGWDGSARSGARLAVLPGSTHYDILHSDHLREVVEEFLD
jgi:pimeloyl-ACP methyl ester carboxylesterase